jgi:hypothetical protein
LSLNPSSFEIMHVKFKFHSAAIVATCPNCALTCADELRPYSGEKQRLLGMYSLDQRIRYVLVFLIGAVITAAALRHVFHVYGGMSREEMRWDAMMAIPLVAVAIAFFRRKRS